CPPRDGSHRHLLKNRRRYARLDGLVSVRSGFKNQLTINGATRRGSCFTFKSFVIPDCILRRLTATWELCSQARTHVPTSHTLGARTTPTPSQRQRSSRPTYKIEIQKKKTTECTTERQSVVRQTSNLRSFAKTIRETRLALI